MPNSAVTTLIVARARHAGPRWLLVVAGLALATVLPVLARAVTTVTADAALSQGLAALPAGERSVIVSYNGLPDPAELARMDGTVRGALPRLTSRQVHRQLIFREINDARGAGFVLGAADDLPRAVRLASGRMPTSCTPTRCEVVQLQGADAVATPDLEPELGLVIVGRVVRTDPLLLTGTFDPGQGKAVLLADGVRAAAANRALEVFGRSYGWTAPFDLRLVHRLGVDGWIGTGAQVADDLWRATPGLVLTIPDDVLQQENSRAQVSAQRFGVLGGTTSVLLLGTAVVGGAALRRDHEAFLGALRRRGVTRRQVTGLVGGEVGLAVLAGTAAGLALAAVVAAVLAARAGLPLGATAAGATAAGLPAVAGLALVAGLLLAATLMLPAGPAGTAPAGVWRATDAAALACLAVAGLLAGRGGVSAQAGGSGGTSDPLVVVLPVLVLIASGLLLARAWPLLTQLGLRWLPRRAIGARLGLAGAGGRPLRPVATAALLTAAVAAAVFAGAYRATLTRGAADQAAYQAPTDARVQVGRTLEQPLDVLPPDLLARLAPGTTAYPVLRAAASLRVSAQQGEPVQLLGIDPSGLTSISRWSAVTGGSDPAGSARALSVQLPAGLALPAGRTLTVSTPGSTVSVAVTAYVQAPDGREEGVPLAVRPPSGSRPATLEGTLPALRTASGSPAPLHLVALTVAQASDQESRRLHALGEGKFDLAVPVGTINLGAISVDGGPLASPWQGWAAQGLTVAGPGDSARLGYRLTQGSVTLQARPGGPGTDVALPILADPATAAAASGGVVTLTLDSAPVRARVVGVLARFPTTQGRFAVADRAAVARLEDLGQAGSGQADELWLSARPGPDQARADQARADQARADQALAAALSRPPFDRLAVQQQAVIAGALRADPVARAAAGLLAAGALITLLVAAAAMVLLVVTERHDDAAAAYAWEADGVPPGVLRQALWWRAVAVAVPAVPAGVLAGVLLSRVTARLVAVTATATNPQPPLVSGIGFGWGALAVLAGLAGALVLAGAVAWSSLREPLPVRDLGVPR